MSLPVLLRIAVGPHAVPLRDALAVAAAAEAAGVAAIRIADTAAAGPALDPTIVAAYLAGVHGDIGYIPELPITGNAPYNAARRILAIDRATGGRAGVALLPGPGWAEYARVLTRLWASFPRAALIGDQERGIVADDARITPIDHDGEYYRVAGPLDGPSSAQGRPLLVADLGEVDASTLAEAADLVVVHAGAVPGSVPGLDRPGVAVFGRVTAPADPDWLLDWAAGHRLAGLELAPPGGTDAVLTVLRDLVPSLVATGPQRHDSLRAAVGAPA
ncbi:LLM class flavin-dependent oxidoreductase [Dactylosporangium vinaceum]|uniref:LLM class flavin-dependent oxidoreductase n=1 Tax=Dactylosporangium vinaceum TaxID=53362 RepID=A0ABV5M2Y8_9ACTN|nr:LLM class flavin-dependent oxidoreductase [Dactylosporangium vinaceum]UAB99823.1 LLM class flavin-dependent oxidoreductase [Dactylosporangium vinaceum]